MNIVLIGSGNVAQSLGSLLVKAGHSILQVMNRTEEPGRKLADLLQADYIAGYADLSPHADLYIIALADKAIPELLLHGKLENKFVVHTAGTIPMAAIAGISHRTGILYPLQSLRGKAPVSGEIPFLLQASQPADLALLQELVQSMNASYQVVNDKQRLQMHVSAVWVNNFPNLMYSIAYRLCQENRLSFDLLLPLIRETGLRLQTMPQPGAADPFLWQTGPAMREDMLTVRKHLECMNPHPDWKDLYEHLTEEIISLKSQVSD
ncbi:F420-dependent NADP oxidoreductase [Flavihumibacter sp. CACIAM 22H1]|uniref:Rossmann-like and DUF2520 domain-containing protein n=1 Tax=Flavihumibacter sp. CACIAM 22H1 TaxID=1812911 RepID=UPI0007A7E283|nr:F420-dependent NADP oxidoreductase [Flavihumibacter sp. CACIAM 22H1]KYP15908.1 MAG: hypothetical protein A1D16_06155 [Flavihumibacter sp. CACIAM 22H1]